MAASAGWTTAAISSWKVLDLLMAEKLLQLVGVQLLLAGLLLQLLPAAGAAIYVVFMLLLLPWLHLRSCFCSRCCC
jgi:hypothetical protein